VPKQEPCQTLDNDWGRFPEFYSWLLVAEDEVKSRAGKVSLTPEEVTRRVKAGDAVLAWEDLSLDWPLLQEYLREVFLAFSHHFPVLAGATEDLQTVVQDTLMLERVIRACYQGGALPRGITKAPGAKAKIDFLRLAGLVGLRPFLCGQREELLPLLNQELWRRPTCPICGGQPDLSFLDREQGARWLVCSRCDTHWLFQRLVCPACQCDDQASLSYLADEEGLFRVYLCDQCHSYLKAVDFRKKEVGIDPARQRLETLDLDRQARHKGYKCPESLVSLWV